MQEQAVEFSGSREKNYLEAETIADHARSNELRRTVELLGDIEGLQVCEYGCGPGSLTKRLAKAVGCAGKVYAFDISQKFMERTQSLGLKSTIVRSASPEAIPLKDNSVDRFVTIATLHHINDKQAFFSEISRVLKRTGFALIVDVVDKTPTQIFFDDGVHEFCSTSHDFPFMDKSKVIRWAHPCQLKVEYFSVEKVPWTFCSLPEAQQFICKLFDSRWSHERTWQRVSELLEVRQERQNIHMEWQLGFCILSH